MNNKCYIAGRVTGDPNYREKFNAAAHDEVLHPIFCAENTARKYVHQHGRVDRFVPVLPTYLSLFGHPIDGMPWILCMLVCIYHLLKCSYVYFLNDWKQSRGARIEHRIARVTHKQIIYQQHYHKLIHK